MTRCAVLCLADRANAERRHRRGSRDRAHDPLHRPLQGAQVVLRAATPLTVLSDSNGEFQFSDVPEGAYTVDVSAPGFRSLQQKVIVAADKSPVLHLQLEIAPLTSSVEVTDANSRLNPQTSRPSRPWSLRKKSPEPRGPTRPTVWR